MKRILMLISFCLLLTGQAQKQCFKVCLEEGLQNNYSLRITHNEETEQKQCNVRNAGYLPTLIQCRIQEPRNCRQHPTKVRESGETIKENGVFDQTIDGLNLQLDYFRRLQHSGQLPAQGTGATRQKQIPYSHRRLVASLAAEYYNFVQQKYVSPICTMPKLSKERLRIVEERYHIGNFSRLDYQQAKVDFNADSAKYMKQQELLHTSRINLNELMANADVDQPLFIEDSIIKVNAHLNFESYGMPRCKPMRLY